MNLDAFLRKSPSIEDSERRLLVGVFNGNMPHARIISSCQHLNSFQVSY